MRIMYVATVEVASRETRLRDAAAYTLADCAPTVTTSPHGWLAIQIQISAIDLAHATATAAALARAATGADVIASQVLTLGEYETRHDGARPTPQMAQQILN